MYTPSKQILENYAKVMIDFAIGVKKGIKAGDTVLIQYYEPAKPLALEIFKRILENGGNPILKIIDDDFTKVMFDFASDKQLEYFPEKYLKGMVDEIDHRIVLLADKDLKLLQSVDPKKIMLANKSKKVYRKWLDEKEDAGNLTWTLCLYGTEAMAQEAGLTIEEYWDQIIKACYLDEQDPISSWKSVYEKLENVLKKLNSLEIDKLHIEAKDTDLWIKLGDKRKFIGGSGHNIPSFEIFTSPDWRGTEGTIFFDYPLYRYGNIINDIKLTFKDGRIVEATASQNENLLKEMIAQENADKIGEFSLTDKKFSRIDKFMAETLFDENFGGEFGNTHLAVGSSYHDTYTGDVKSLSENDWADLGYNESPEHCDIMATTNRKVTAILKNGNEVLIYENGEFVI